MSTYRVLDRQGEIVGELSLIDDFIPNALMEDLDFRLGGAYRYVDANTKQFLNYFIVPVPASEKREQGKLDESNLTNSGLQGKIS